MGKKRFWKRSFAVLMSLAVTGTTVLSGLGDGAITARAAETKKGSIATDRSEVTGSYYWDKGSATNASLLDKLPYKGSSYRYTTANYDAKHGAFDTSDWATSFMWDLDRDNPYSSTVYAIPLAFRASIDGGAKNVMQVTAPSSLSDYANSTYTMQMASNGSITDFYIQAPFDTSSAKVDNVTDWSYDVVMEKAGDTSTYMKTTMVQGSIFAYFELAKANSLEILRGKKLPAAVTYRNGEGNVIVVRCFDNGDEDYDYYAFYGAKGTTFQESKNPDVPDWIGSIKANFSSGAYMTLAYLGSTKSENDNWAQSMCQAYLPYAYNFVTDTQATYSYHEDTSTVETVYSYTFNKKPESTADGTIMGVLPHQYKNIKDGTTFLDYTYQTIRGKMKTIAGSSFTTELTYSGILPFMPDYTDDAAEQKILSGYLDDYVTRFDGEYFSNYEGDGDTYWDGKGLNRISNAIAAARVAGDDRANDMFAALRSRLEDWFTYSGKDDGAYFYYDKGVGALFGFPQSYNSVDQINDHHFHYGYFIYAAAQVAFQDPTFAAEYGDIVNELVYDIACPTRNSASSRYPYLRNFAPYEGHSWASGHANFDMGNNQESSSEALNAWAGIILWGEASGNQQLRDLGIYLYTTEVSAVQNYWYDVDEDVLSDAFRYNVPSAQVDFINKETAKVVNNSAAIVWGGSYTYATWFSASPYHIQGINLLPMNPTCFYLAGNADYIQQNYELAKEKAAGKFNPDWVEIWEEYYAMAYPEQALANWLEKERAGYNVEGGETKAHAYHFIKTLSTYGTPDTSISSNTALSTVFVKDGVKTYVAYNPTDKSKTVTFSDGIQITVGGNSMTAVKETEIAGVHTYKIKYYKQNLDGNYDEKDVEVVEKAGMLGSKVEAAQKAINGFTFNGSDQNNELSGTITDDNGLVLKLYYTRNSYTIKYVLNGGTNDGKNPDKYKFGAYPAGIVLEAPTREGYVFGGWYENAKFTGNKVTTIAPFATKSYTLYAKWTAEGQNEEPSTRGESGVEIRDGKLVLYITKEVQAVGDVIAHWKIYDSLDAAKQAPLSDLPGYKMTSSGSGWKYDTKEAVSDSKYLAYAFNQAGMTTPTAIAVADIPVAEGGDEDEDEGGSGGDGGGSGSEEPGSPERIGRGAEYKDGTIYFWVTDADEGVREVKAAFQVYNSKEEAEERAKEPKDTGIPSVELTQDKETKCWATEYKKELKETDYILYAFYFAGGSEEGLGAWNITTKEELTTASYKVQYYQQSTDLSGYTLKETEKLTGTIGENVKAPIKSYPGFTQNPNAKGTLTEDTVKRDDSLILKLYYDRDSYNIKYQLDGGINHAANPSKYVYGVGISSLQEPTKAGYTFEGWYENAGFTGSKVTAVPATWMGAVTLYAKWTKNQSEPGTSGGSGDSDKDNPDKDNPDKDNPDKNDPDNKDDSGNQTNPGKDDSDNKDNDKDEQPEKTNATAPTISTNLSTKTKSYGYKEKATLKVVAKSTDGGKLSYQWYSNTKQSASGAKKISKATKATYIVPTSKLGTTYYFCKITNTNSSATGNQTATKDSDIAAIKVVKAANPITKVSKYSKAIGSKLTLKPAGSATYKTSDKKVATVTKKGKVTFKSFGKATITVKAKGNKYYKAATKKITIEVTPKKAALSSVKSTKSKTIEVKWKKDTKATGYQIQYSTTRNFKSKKTVNVKENKTTSAAIKKLAGKKTYYVRVREYKQVSRKVTVYGSWSTVRSVKVKK